MAELIRRIFLVTDLTNYDEFIIDTTMNVKELKGKFRIDEIKNNKTKEKLNDLPKSFKEEYLHDVKPHNIKKIEIKNNPIFKIVVLL